LWLLPCLLVGWSFNISQIIFILLEGKNWHRKPSSFFLEYYFRNDHNVKHGWSQHPQGPPFLFGKNWLFIFIFYLKNIV
jgi:hypothetical protein